MPGGALPNLVVIGAMKCATTSLYHYLGAHPHIAMSRRKELNFFSDPTEWARGIDWYRSWFDAADDVRGEASPAYTTLSCDSGASGRLRDVPQRMRQVIPDAKLIYLVRDPLDRLKAHYHHKVAARQEHRPIEEALEDPELGLVSRSLYAYQLDAYLSEFPTDQILVLQQEQLLEHRERELERVFRFLGVDPGFRSLLFRYRHHRTVRKRRLTPAGAGISRLPVLRSLRRLPGPVRWPLQDLVYWPFSEPVPPPVLSPDVEERLLDRFRADVARLREITGMPFRGWCV